MSEDAQAPVESPSQAEGDNDLQALAPDVTLPLAGVDVTVREYGFFEGLRVLSAAPNFMAAFKAKAFKGEITFASVRILVGAHLDEVLGMMAASTGQTVEFIRGLSDEDQELLLSTWFAVHTGFFVREVVMEQQENLLRTTAAQRSIGSDSSPPSAPPASAELTNSEGSQNAS